ncbi:hypothetical protein [Massilia sp. GCM10023247]|uniref:hypothetical protein n=1 Tax=Massilia sp. GCM10023247 TaxID=3252643 RepID=UPI003612B6BA
MKRLPVLLMVAALGGCALPGSKQAPPAASAAAPVSSQAIDSGAAPVERVPYRVGVSSVTVEQLARRHACAGQGAGLVTEPGPVEVYRLQCADGKVFMARCELRQCRKM